MLLGRNVLLGREMSLLSAVVVFTASLSLVGSGWVISSYIRCNKRITDALFALASSEVCLSLLFILQGVWSLADFEGAKMSCTNKLFPFIVFFQMQSCTWTVSLSYQLLNDFLLHDPSENIRQSDLKHHALNAVVGICSVIYHFIGVDDLVFTSYGLCWTAELDENILYGIVIPASSLSLVVFFYRNLYIRAKKIYTLRASVKAAQSFSRIIFWAWVIWLVQIASVLRHVMSGNKIKTGSPLSWIFAIAYPLQVQSHSALTTQNPIFFHLLHCLYLCFHWFSASQGFGNAIIIYTSSNVFQLKTTQENDGLEISNISMPVDDLPVVSFSPYHYNTDDKSQFLLAKSTHQARSPAAWASGFGMSLHGISHKDLAFSPNPVLLGIGGAAKVFKAKLFNRVVAVKKLVGLASIPDECKEEAVMQVKLQHPNILSLFGVVYDLPKPKDDLGSQDFWIVLEFASRGSIADVIHNRNRVYKLRHMLKWAQDACLGLAYLHTRIVPLLHRDLKVLPLSLLSLSLSAMMPTSIRSNTHSTDSQIIFFDLYFT